VASTIRKLEVVFSRSGRHLEKYRRRRVSALGGPISMKFSNFMQNIMRITVMWSKSKQEEEIQYGGRLFLPNGNSYISAVI